MEKRIGTVLVVDGQGGGIGRSIIESLKDQNAECHITAAGTNYTACAKMKKAGADRAVCGEAAIINECAHADVVCGPMGIVISGALMGEISPRTAETIAESDAVKVLIPLNKCRIFVAGVGEKNLTRNIDEAVGKIKVLLKDM